jgi:flavin-binding protein dodecin
MTDVAKVIEIVGSSDKSWQDAAQAVLDEGKKTIRGITGLEGGDMTAKVDPNSGNITEYHTAVKIAFGVKQYFKQYFRNGCNSWIFGTENDGRSTRTRRRRRQRCGRTR